MLSSSSIQMSSVLVGISYFDSSVAELLYQSVDKREASDWRKLAFETVGNADGKREAESGKREARCCL